MFSVSEDAQRLITTLTNYRRVVVAFSGGVDSSVVAAAAVRAELSELEAVTADSASVPRWQLQLAKQIADEIGIEHQTVSTNEGTRVEYRRNDNRRCFYCKETLYTMIGQIARERRDAVIVSGTNADDLGDYRPGIEAGHMASVKTPLADLGITKSRVRELAHHFGLSNEALPASPCLASRIAYGIEVTPERLNRIESAEAWLHGRGFDQVRVRLHADELARVEVPAAQISLLTAATFADELTREFRSFGFNFVTVDLQGLQSGSLNRVLVSLDSTIADRAPSDARDDQPVRADEVWH